MALASRHRFTVAQYDAMFETGILVDRRVELIDGEIVQMPAMGSRHFAAVSACGALLHGLLETRAVVAVQCNVVLGDFSKPEPDVVVAKFRTDRYRDQLPGADDLLLLIEIADSSLASDLGEKVPLYARFGVAEVLVADLTSDRVGVHRDPSPPGYRSVEWLERGSTVTPLAFADLVLAVDAILGY